MKIAAFIPIHNQEVRIQPLMRKIESKFSHLIEFYIFIDEGSTDRSDSVLAQELLNLHKPYEHIKKLDHNRKDSFIQTWNLCLKKKIDFLITFHEGWEDNIEEIHQYTLTQDFTKFALITSVRTPSNENLGHLYNTLSNLFASKVLQTDIPETKGDSINIYSLQAFPVEIIQNVSDQIFHLAFITFAKQNNLPIQFTTVDNGLNFASYIKLNTKRFIQVLRFLKTLKY